MAARLVRLKALLQHDARLRVDRTFPGRIYGLSIATTGPALGHGFELDRTTVEQVAENAHGIAGRWTHGNLSEDGLARHLGRWQEITTQEFVVCRACQAELASYPCSGCGGPGEQALRAVGTFAFSESAHKIRPDGLDVPAPVYLMTRAGEDPQSLGISIVARFGFYEPPVEEGERTRRFGRIEKKKDLLRGDWVGDPAANPVGLHAGTNRPSALTEEATHQLDRIVAREGKAKARLRAFAFLARYFSDEGAPEQADDGDLHAELAELRRTVAAYKAAEEERQEGETLTYLEHLRTRSAELNSPIPAADLEEVERLLRAGDESTAKLLGRAFLSRSEAHCQVPFQRSGEHTLGEDETKRRLKASVAARARILRRQGWGVEVSDDGTHVVSTTPPQEGRA